jgi:hypothetical protein
MRYKDVSDALRRVTKAGARVDGREVVLPKPPRVIGIKVLGACDFLAASGYVITRRVS